MVEDMTHLPADIQNYMRQVEYNSMIQFQSRIVFLKSFSLESWLSWIRPFTSQRRKLRITKRRLLTMMLMEVEILIFLVKVF